MSAFEPVPMTLQEAADFVARNHRHSGRPVGHKFSVGAVDKGGDLRGVVIVGRPVARLLDDGRTLEALRCCTDGAANACSFLYATAWRAARALGYRRMVTYTHADETGASLFAAGWKVTAQVRGRSWDCPSRRRKDQPLLDKMRWQVEVSGSR